MRRQSTMRAALSRLWRSERGFALPTVLMIIVAGLGLSGAAVVASTQTQSGSIRDADSKGAIAAADAGVELALYRLNHVETTETEACVVTSGGSLAAGDPAADGWCPEFQSAPGELNGASYRYRMKPWVLVEYPGGDRRQVEIVSIGTSDQVSRRVRVTASSPIEAPLFGSSSVIGRDFITMDSNARVDGNAGTNGGITLSSNAVLCGSATVGIGQSLTLNGNSEQCEGYGTQEAEMTLPQVVQGDVVTNNSNGRFFSQDLRTGGSSVTYNASTRTLTLNSNSTLTMGGSRYSLCRLVMNSNSIIFIASGAHVSVYFDSPEACGLPDGSTQMELNSNTRILSTDHDPTSAAFLFVGSDDLTTRVQLDSNTQVDEDCDQDFVIYGPRTEIELNSNSVFCGGIAGKTLHLESNARVVADARVQEFTAPVEIVYSSDRYVECTGGEMPSGAGTQPDDYC